MQASSLSAVTLQNMPQQQQKTISPGVPAGYGSSATARACVGSSDLLRGQRDCDIEHNGAVYRLQVTRLGKLILTK